MFSVQRVANSCAPMLTLLSPESPKTEEARCSGLVPELIFLGPNRVACLTVNAGGLLQKRSSGSPLMSYLRVCCRQHFRHWKSPLVPAIAAFRSWRLTYNMGGNRNGCVHVAFAVIRRSFRWPAGDLDCCERLNLRPICFVAGGRPLQTLVQLACAMATITNLPVAQG